MMDHDVLPSTQSAPFRSLKSSRRPGFIGSLLFGLIATSWWCAVAVLVHLLIRPRLRASFEDNPLSVFGLYFNLFKDFTVEESNAGSSALFSLLAAVVGLAIVLRGVVWEVQDLPEDSRVYRAWLQRTMDASVREDTAIFLTAMLCGLYGIIVVCYGFLAGGRGWRGFSLVVFLVLVVLSLIVSILPAFVIRSSAGVVSSYAYSLIRLANLAECRCHNESGDAHPFKVGKDGELPRIKKVVSALVCKNGKGWWALLGKNAGVCLVVLASIVVIVARFDSENISGVVVLAAYMVFVALLFELLIPLALYVNSNSIAVGGSNFGRGALVVFASMLSLLGWVMYVMLFIGAVSSCWGIVVICLPVWWFIRFLLALFVKPSAGNGDSSDGGQPKGNDDSNNDGQPKKANAFQRICAFLRGGVGLRDAMLVCIDQCMLESRGLVNSCVNRNLQVATELNAVFDQVVPKGSVVSRGDGGEVDLRKYLSETVKVTLPPVPETGSGAGK